MLRVAIVEDERAERERLASFLKRFGEEQKLEISIEEFSDGKQLVEEYEFNFDLIFLDIEMRQLNGMQTAREIRKRDREVLLLFVTNLVQYAIEGYEVEAVDYVLKPLSYTSFCLRMKKVMKKRELKAGTLIPFRVRKETVFLNAQDIFYVETMDKKTQLILEGGLLPCSETMTEIEEKLVPYGFFRCHNAFLVNMNQIRYMKGLTVQIAETSLPISKYRKHEFYQAVARYEGALL